MRVLLARPDHTGGEVCLVDAVGKLLSLKTESSMFLVNCSLLSCQTVVSWDEVASVELDSRLVCVAFQPSPFNSKMKRGMPKSGTILGLQTDIIPNLHKNPSMYQTYSLPNLHQSLITFKNLHCTKLLKLGQLILENCPESVQILHFTKPHFSHITFYQTTFLTLYQSTKNLTIYQTKNLTLCQFTSETYNVPNHHKN